ncbi:glycerol-3-phosphate acyltransferase [Haematobacter missouriensis]|uniref:Glycerol-3-phosphate acyltransferase n=1 Tax=Haematobacter missouriensis TaxID=366616 RepID=A0A212AL10_9RHOB|nr:glycerol-3-phosphate 1-O-acyltransferase PlsY [Haematobacter missouriensis]KFI29485.1 glycerol-3-phosphate acyltransferase [Haematobacter missouriensis]OWJ80105.1 glycerol-3-phosphate acyltransferase [Haematobacter missouriensis]OWJ82145.1 glycerol-3-phosphate acyltransferase [Haematobacter missouriensis]
MPALTSSPLALIVTAVLAYLVGSIPFGLLLARAMGLGNLRKIGSGNIGATNVLRTGNKKAAALTLLLDAVKGAVPVLLARILLGEDAAQVAGLAAFLGHLFPVWIGFRGGKGVATFLGVVLALAWPVGVAACVAWLVVAYATRYSSLSALVAAALSPVWAWVLGYQQMVGLILLLVVLIFLRHHENITRLIAGTESRIGAKK